MVNSFHLRTSLIRILLFPALGTLTKCQFLKLKIQVARAQRAIAQMLKCENVCPIAVVITKTSFSRPPGTDIFTITTSWNKEPMTKMKLLRNYRDRHRIRMRHVTWKSITSCISIAWYLRELTLKCNLLISGLLTTKHVSIIYYF